MAKKRKAKKTSAAAELNVMPFIDIFSMLVTFLLVSAAFVSIGIVKVQVPFLSNAPEDKSKPSRDLIVDVHIEKEKILLSTQFSLPPKEKFEKSFSLNKNGIDNLHNDLVAIKQKNPDADKVTVYSDDDIGYQDLVLVIDAISLLKESDPTISSNDSSLKSKAKVGLFDKVVMGSVLL